MIQEQQDFVKTKFHPWFQLTFTSFVTSAQASAAICTREFYNYGTYNLTM